MTIDEDSSISSSTHSCLSPFSYLLSYFCSCWWSVRLFIIIVWSFILCLIIIKSFFLSPCFCLCSCDNQFVFLLFSDLSFYAWSLSNLFFFAHVDDQFVFFILFSDLSFCAWSSLDLFFLFHHDQFFHMFIYNQQ